MTTPPLGTTAEFWRICHAEPVIWFVGSFVSVWEPSALPSAYALTSGLLSALANGTEIESILKEAAGRNWPKDWPRLESTLQELHYCVGDLAADALAPLRGGTPNAYHHFIAAHLPRARKVYTTNQDELIEAALRAAGHLEGRDFVVWLPGHREPDASKMHVVKLHGTASDAKSIRTTVRQVHGGLPDDMKRRLTADLSSRYFCVAGYSGNDIDVRPVFLAARPRGAFWLDRRVNAFALALATTGKQVWPTLVDLSTFLPSSAGLTQSVTSPTTRRSHSSRSILSFVRARCHVALVSPRRTIRDSIAVRKQPPGACRMGTRRPGAFGTTSVNGTSGTPERFSRFWRFITTLPAGAARQGTHGGKCCVLRGMWMSCDLLLLGLFAWTYRLGLLFEPPARRAASRMPFDERDYGAALIDLFELRGALRNGQVVRARAIAERLLQIRTIGGHLRGHALRAFSRNARR